MRAHNINTVAREFGFCCAAFFLKMEEVKGQAKGWKSFSPAALDKKTGLAYNTCQRLKRRWLEGDIKCECQANCLKAKWGGKEPEAHIDSNMKAWMALRGQNVSIFACVPGKYELVREEPITPAIITELSIKMPWLWIKVTLSADRECYLGDRIYIDAITDGTIFDIDGRNLYILLPGYKHKARAKSL